MKQKADYSPLFIVVILFIVGAVFPSDGVDAAIQKTPGELMNGALKILSAGVVVVLIIKTIQLSGSAND